MKDWYELTDIQKGKTYRIRYENLIDKEKRMRWRKGWKDGKLRFRCGCGCPFGWNARGAIYYPAGVEAHHKKDCIKFKEERVKETIRLMDVPKHPRDAGVYKTDWEPVYRDVVTRFKQSDGQSVISIFNVYCQLANQEKRVTHFLRKASECQEGQRFLVISRVQEGTSMPYGFIKVILLDSNQKRFVAWFSNRFIETLGRPLSVDDVFVGFCYVRLEQWKGTAFRKVYVLEGVIG